MKLSQIVEARYSGEQDNLKIIAEELETGMAGRGILDDADEILADIQQHDGDDAARQAVKNWNLCFDFINQLTGSNLAKFTPEWVEEQLANYQDQHPGAQMNRMLRGEN